MTDNMQVALIGAGATVGAALIGVGVAVWQTRKTLAAGRASPNPEPLSGALPKPPAHMDPEVGNEGVFWRHDAAGSADVLFVLVHGLNGEARGSWDDLPQHLQARLRSHGRADVFSFAYGAGMFQSASIETAAQALQSFLKNPPQAYRHIILVAHSAGGLVARRAVIREFDRIMSLADSPGAGDDHRTRNLEVANSFVFRLRRLNAVAVPHWGGTRLFTCLLVPYYVLLPIMLLQERVIRFVGWCWEKLRRKEVSRPGYEHRQHWGWNRIPWQLRHQNGGLAKLRADWHARTDRAVGRVFAFPSSWEISGSEDSVIAEEEAAVDASGPLQRSGTLLSGDHVRVNKTSSANDSLVTTLTEPTLSLFSRRLSVLVAYETARRTIEFAARATLIGDEAKPQAGSQRKAFAQLRSFICRVAEGPALAVVVGDTGTGKSMVLRTISRDCCNRFLGGTPGEGREVLHLPLEIFRKFSADVANSPEALWRELQERWLANASGIAGTALSMEWMEDVLRQRPCLLVLDSTDEFLLNNPNVAQPVLLAMIRHLRAGYSSNAQLRIIAGARLTHPLHEPLQNLADETVSITHLNRSQIEQYFPLTYRFLADDGARVLDSNAIELLTPLVLDAIEEFLRTADDHHASLAAWRDELELRDPLRGHGLLEVAIHATLRKARIHEAGAGRIADYYLALALLAMVYAQEFASELTEAEIVNGVEGIRRRLEPALDSHDERPIARQARDALRLLHEPSSRSRLLACSLFFPTRKFTGRDSVEDSFRFKHREWHDSLLGRYFALCFQIPVLGELRKVAFLQRSQRVGGEILRQLKPEKHSLANGAAPQRFGLDLAFAQQLVKAMQQPDGHFILGNVGGLIGNSPILISDPALTLLLAHRDVMPGGGKLVFFAGIGHRILRQFDDDESWSMLRQRAAEIFGPQLNPGACRHPATSAGNERVIASLSWCYLRELARLWPENAPPADPWPGLCQDAAEARQVVDRLHAVFLDGSTMTFAPPSDVYRNCQFAFAFVQPEVLRYPESRPISVVHYLYTLALTAQGGVFIPQAHTLLMPVLTNDSPYERIYRNHPIAELAQIFDESRRLLAQLDACDSR